MHFRETCTKCGFDSKSIPICPVLKTNHALLTKSLFTVTQTTQGSEGKISGREATLKKPSGPPKGREDILFDLCRRSYVVMASLSMQHTQNTRKKCLAKIKEADSSDVPRIWSTVTVDGIRNTKHSSIKSSTEIAKVMSTEKKHDVSYEESQRKSKIPSHCVDLEHDTDEVARRKSRMDRFSSAKRQESQEKIPISSQYAPALSCSSAEQSSTKIVGTSISLEKPYYRLQEVPDPSDVRPIHVLIEAFDFVTNKAQSMQHKKGKEYLNEQLKSIRQDISIQQIETTFSIDVYESQARLSLELGDHIEFNQCQSRLKTLYANVNMISCDNGMSQHTNELEFLGYRLVYSAIMQNDFGLSADISTLNESQKNNAEVQYVLNLVFSISSNTPALIFTSFCESKLLPYGYGMRCLLRKLFDIRRSRWCITLLGTCGPRETMTLQTLAFALGFQLESEESFDVSTVQSTPAREMDSRVMGPILDRTVEFLLAMNVTVLRADGDAIQSRSGTQDDEASGGYQQCKDYYVYCTAAAKQISDYLTYVHTRTDAKHAMQVTGTL